MLNHPDFSESTVLNYRRHHRRRHYPFITQKSAHNGKGKG